MRDKYYRVKEDKRTGYKCRAFVEFAARLHERNLGEDTYYHHALVPGSQDMVACTKIKLEDLEEVPV